MQQLEQAGHDGHPFWVARQDLHVGIWLLLLINFLISKSAHLPVSEILHGLTSANIVVITAFMVIFHLLTDEKAPEGADKSDYIAFVTICITITLSSTLGTHYDVSLIMGILSLYYFFGATQLRDHNYIGFTYAALAFNGLIAPLIFHLIKDAVLIGEAQAAAMFMNLFGFNVAMNGAWLTGESGMRLHMVGACSIYTNLSLALLGYASVKAFLKQAIQKTDIVILLMLFAGLLMTNTVRLGLMTPSVGAYEYWHHGTGATIVAISQFALIAGICASAVVLHRRSCPV